MSDLKIRKIIFLHENRAHTEWEPKTFCEKSIGCLIYNALVDVAADGGADTFMMGLRSKNGCYSRAIAGTPRHILLLIGSVINKLNEYLEAVEGEYDEDEPEDPEAEKPVARIRSRRLRDA